MQGARHGTRSWDSRIRPWAEGGAKPLSHPGCPFFFFFKCDMSDISSFFLISAVSFVAMQNTAAHHLYLPRCYVRRHDSSQGNQPPSRCAPAPPWGQKGGRGLLC